MSLTKTIIGVTIGVILAVVILGGTCIYLIGDVTEPEITTIPVPISTPTPPSTSTSTPSPESTPIPTSKRGSYENPASMSEKVIVKYGGESLGITVLAVERGEEVWNSLYAANIFNSKPKQGFEYLFVKIEIEYISGQSSKFVSDWDFKAFSEGVSFGSPFVIMPYNRPKLGSVELMPGGKIEGWICFEVPEDKNVLIAYEYLFEPSCFINVGS